MLAFCARLALACYLAYGAFFSGDVLELPVVVGDGPLLFFRAPLDLPIRERRRIPRLFVVDVESGGPPQLVRRGIGSGIRLHERFDRTTVLIQNQADGLQLLDLATGARRVLQPGTRQELLAVVGDRSWFLEHRAEREGGMRLESGTDRGTLVKTYDRPESYLYSFAFGSEEQPQLWWSEPIERVLALHRDALWVVKKGEPCELWKLPTDRALAPEKLIALDPTWITSMIHPAFSPDGRFLALGLSLDHHFDTRCDLAVIDLRQGVELRRFEAVENRRPGELIRGPFPMEPYWVSNRALSWHNAGNVMLDVLTCERSPELVVDGSHIAQDDRLSMTDLRQRLGCFERMRRVVQALGEPGPGREAIEAPPRYFNASEWVVSPDGRWAVGTKDEHPEHRLVLVDGFTATRRVLSEEWASETTWLAGCREGSEATAVESEADLHGALGRRVTLRGVAMHSAEGPVLVMNTGLLVYVPELMAHSVEDLGRRVSLAGRLDLWYSADPLDRRTVWSSSYRGLYVLTELGQR